MARFLETVGEALMEAKIGMSQFSYEPVQQTYLLLDNTEIEDVREQVHICLSLTQWVQDHLVCLDASTRALTDMQEVMRIRNQMGDLERLHRLLVRPKELFDTRINLVGVRAGSWQALVNSLLDCGFTVTRFNGQVAQATALEHVYIEWDYENNIPIDATLIVRSVVYEHVLGYVPKIYDRLVADGLFVR